METMLERDFLEPIPLWTWWNLHSETSLHPVPFSTSVIEKNFVRLVVHDRLLFITFGFLMEHSALKFNPSKVVRGVPFSNYVFLTACTNSSIRAVCFSSFKFRFTLAEK
jgi:hypothetical protein